MPDAGTVAAAVRTRAINDAMGKWIEDTEAKGQKMQVTNMGCGVDTRPFWVDSLKKVERYVEVDVEKINTFRAKKLEEL